MPGARGRGRARRLLAALAAAAATAAASPPRAVAGCANPFDDPDEVLDFHLRLARQTWTQLVLDQPVQNGTCLQYPWRRVEFRCGADEPWIAIGARHKRGDQRGLDTREKPPLKLDFNRFVAGQSWPAGRGKLGHLKLSMNSGQPDGPGDLLSVLLTEHLGWRLMRREVPPASASAYARLFVHFTDEGKTEYHGVYILIEDIGKDALRRRLGVAADVGWLYKMTGGTCDGVDFDDGPPNEARDRFNAWQRLSPSAFPNAWWNETDKAMHLDELLRQEAMRDFWANNDNILNDARNYVVFDPRAGRRLYLPWDLDDAFRIPGHSTTETMLGCQQSLAQRTRCQPEIRGRTLAMICQMVNGTLSPAHVLGQAERIDRILRPLIPQEVPLVWGGRDPLRALATGTSYQEELEHLRTWVPRRLANVRQQLAAAGLACPDRCAEGETLPCSSLGCAGIRRCKGGLWEACELQDGACRPAAPSSVDAGAGTSPADGAAAPARDGGAPAGDAAVRAAAEAGARDAAAASADAARSPAPPSGPDAVAGGSDRATAAASEPPGASGASGSANAGCACALGRARETSPGPAGACALALALVARRSSRSSRRGPP